MADVQNYEQAVTVALSNPLLSDEHRARLNDGKLSLAVVKALQTYDPDAHAITAINKAAEWRQQQDGTPALKLESAPRALEVLSRSGVAEALWGLVEDIFDDSDRLAAFIDDLSPEEAEIFIPLFQRLHVEEVHVD